MYFILFGLKICWRVRCHLISALQGKHMEIYIVSALQGEHMETYLISVLHGVHTCILASRKLKKWQAHTATSLLNLIPYYEKVMTISELVGVTEEIPRVCNRQRNRDNHPSDSVFQYWKRTVTLPYLNIVCSEHDKRFTEEYKAHYELCDILPEALMNKDNDAVLALGKALCQK